MRGLRMVLLTVLTVGTLVLAITVLQIRAQQTPTSVTSQTVLLNGVEAGQVLVSQSPVFTFTAPAGGYTPAQRAAVVASRLIQLMNQGYNWQNLAVGRMNGQVVLLMGNNLLTTVDRAEARANRTTPLALAYTWRDRTIAALGGSTPIAGVGTPTVVAGTAESWPAWTNPATKIVPIFSLGTPGLRVGFAQVTGPAERINDVRSVIQIDAVFQRAARARVLVPSSELTGLNRVQGTAVTALLQYGLVRF